MQPVAPDRARVDPQRQPGVGRVSPKVPSKLAARGTAFAHVRPHRAGGVVGAHRPAAPHFLVQPALTQPVRKVHQGDFRVSLIPVEAAAALRDAIE